MKRILLCFLCLSMLSACLPNAVLAEGAAAHISLQSDPTELYRGSELQVLLTVKDITDLSGIAALGIYGTVGTDALLFTSVEAVSLPDAWEAHGNFFADPLGEHPVYEDEEIVLRLRFTIAEDAPIGLCSCFLDVRATNNDLEEVLLSFDRLTVRILCKHEDKTRTTVKAPTCTESGLESAVCNICGQRFEDQTLPPMPHSAGEWIVLTEPTFSDRGERRKCCKTCNAVLQTEYLPRLEHLRGDLDDSGELDALDYFAIKQIVLQMITVSDAKERQADIDGSGDVDALDYFSVKQVVLGIRRYEDVVGIYAPQNGKEFSQPKTTSEYEKEVGIAYSVDMTKFEQYVDPTDASAFLRLVNKDHPLEEGFVPEDLVKIKDMQKGRPDYYSYMCRYAEIALEAFLEEGRQYGIEGWDAIGVRNGYRSYEIQAKLYNNYVSQEKKAHPTWTDAQIHAYVQTYSSYPGTSEHQLGLSADITNIDASGSGFDGTPAAIWMEENCYRFGFVKRYPEDKQDITGIINESWHFRFVGREAATEMYRLNMCLEEYCAYKGIA